MPVDIFQVPLIQKVCNDKSYYESNNRYKLVHILWITKVIAGGNKVNQAVAGEVSLAAKLRALSGPFSKKLSVQFIKFTTTSLDILSDTLFAIVHSFLTDSALNKLHINIIKFTDNCLVDLRMLFVKRVVRQLNFVSLLLETCCLI